MWGMGGAAAVLLPATAVQRAHAGARSTVHADMSDIEPLNKIRMERMRGEVCDVVTMADQRSGDVWNKVHAIAARLRDVGIAAALLHIEPEVHHISFFDHVLLPFQPKQPLFLHLCLRPARH